VHWSPISPTQSYEMFQRLRPNRIGRFGPDFARMRPFTLQDVRDMLRINDYPPSLRDQPTAIAYRRPRLVDIDRFFTSGQIDEEEVYELHLDLGYTVTDARMRTNWLKTEKLKKDYTADEKRWVRQIVKLYVMGKLTWTGGADKIIQFLTGKPLWVYFQPAPVGADGALFAWAKNIAYHAMTTADIDIQVKEGNILMRLWRRRLYRGMNTFDEVKTEMAANGWSTPGINRFIAEVQAELAGGRLMLSTSWIKRMACTNCISIAMANDYLRNLGWVEPEIDWLLCDIERCVSAEQSAMQAKNARDTKTKAAALERQANALKRKRKEVLSTLNKQASPTKLRRYYVRNVINEEEYVSELQKRGFDEHAIELQLADAKIDRAAYRATKRGGAAGTNGTTVNGTAGS
jgi:hypothetical protein